MTGKEAGAILQELVKIRELLERQDTTRLLTAEDVANRLKVSADYVYRHAVELGGVRLQVGDGKRRLLRFPVAAVDRVAEDRAWEAATTNEVRTETAEGVELLPVGRPGSRSKNGRQP